MPPAGDAVSTVTIVDEMRRSYLDYAMSVIVSRALPDARDGLKPVHRRILYAMFENGYGWNRPYRKSARVVGDVMGKYHPHGDSAIYDAMVRMAQDFSMRLELIDGQGNFGSIDGDPPAAMRYTEVRMARAAATMLEDIEFETVDFQDNYDASASEPSVLPARFPNLLVNGTGGIAVGMATNVPPHNLVEVISACLALIDDPTLSVQALTRYIPGPDFPTGGLIIGRRGCLEGYCTGRGRVVMRGRATVEDRGKKRSSIIISEIPFQVIKARMIEQIADRVRSKDIEGVSALRDESDRDGLRIVVELKGGTTPAVVLNQLYKFTSLQTSFGINALALHDGKPECLDLKQLLEAFLSFRESVITKRTLFLLKKARAQAHVLLGLVIAVANLDAVIALIRAAADAAAAREQLVNRAWPAAEVGAYLELIAEPGREMAADGTCRLTERQAKAILDLQLHRLTGLEREKIGSELQDKAKEIDSYLETLRSRPRLLEILRAELEQIRDQFGTPRRTEIVDGDEDADRDDLIEREDMVVTLTRDGYVKRTELAAYRSQRRGGKGRSAMAVKDDDFVTHVFTASTHDPVLFFTSHGIVHRRKVYDLPLGTPQARGRPIVNVLRIDGEEQITTMLPQPSEGADEEAASELVFATRAGYVRRNRMSDFASINVNGKIAMKLDPGDTLVEVAEVTPDMDLMLATRRGRAIRFPLNEVRVFVGRASRGVRGVRFQKKQHDEVIGMSVLPHTDAPPELRKQYLRYTAGLRRNETPVDPPETAVLKRLAAEEVFVLSVTEQGFGKQTSSHEYRTTARGGQGVINIQTEGRNGPAVCCFPVAQTDEVMVVTDLGRIIRCPVSDIRVAGRGAQGVRVLRLDSSEKVVSVTRFDVSEDDEAAGGPPPTRIPEEMSSNDDEVA